MLTRRNFGKSLLALSATPYARYVHSQTAARPHILLRSSWQVVNIGDIAHTPGVLALIERHIPEAEVRLWASGDLSDEVIEMEHRRFPQLRIVKGTIQPDGRASNPELQETIDWSDFLLHGSGPSLVAAKDVAAYEAHTHKPFGVYGITHGSFLSGDDRELLGKAEFVYFRDSVSLEFARSEGISAPILGFAPDGAFACDLRDEIRAEKFLAANGLEDHQFLCCLSRLRYTPYWTIPGKNRKFDADRHARNESMKEQDHLPIRDAIVEIARQTQLKVLLCPEDMTQMSVGKELLYDRLPSDVKSRVVWRENFWLTDEALSVYVRSAGLFGSEMHSPIMAVGNGVPAIVCRFEEQTSKGFMWRDIGLGDWLFDLDNPQDRSHVSETVLSLAQNPEQALTKTAGAQKYVRQCQTETMGQLRKSLGLSAV
jgi:polysaccharide pyruvyl transferase WcaK-like protein